MSIRDEKDSNVYICGYLQNLEVRRVKFAKEKKKKVEKFYQDLRKYLDEAYFQFES